MWGGREGWGWGWETTSFVDDETAQSSFVDHPQN